MASERTEYREQSTEYSAPRSTRANIALCSLNSLNSLNSLIAVRHSRQG